MTVPQKQHPVIGAIAVTFSAIVAYYVGHSVLSNLALIDQSVNAAGQSLHQGSMNYFITFTLIAIGGTALGGLAVILGWMCKTAADSTFNRSETIANTFRALRNASWALGLIAATAMVMTYGMQIYNERAIVSGFAASKLYTQVNNLPIREDRALFADLESGRWYRAVTDTDMMAEFKAGFRGLGWSERRGIEDFLARSVSRSWDIPTERAVRVSLTTTATSGHLRFAVKPIPTRLNM